MPLVGRWRSSFTSKSSRLSRLSQLKLMVDGRCGPKTLDAIRKFQSRQFGVGGADGRADPNGRTLARLNQFDSGVPLLTMSSVLQCPHGGTIQCIPGGRPPFAPISRGLPISMTDTLVVAGCNFPTPCVRVRWANATAQALDGQSVGLCLNAANMPQGTVMLARA